jgi:hypothetical protein
MRSLLQFSIARTFATHLNYRKFVSSVTSGIAILFQIAQLKHILFFNSIIDSTYSDIPPNYNSSLETVSAEPRVFKEHGLGTVGSEYS